MVTIFWLNLSAWLIRCIVPGMSNRKLISRNADLPENRRLNFRIGINLGDVIENEDRIYGDGINIAAQFESLAEKAEIRISGTFTLQELLIS